MLFSGVFDGHGFLVALHSHLEALPSPSFSARESRNFMARLSCKM